MHCQGKYLTFVMSESVLISRIVICGTWKFFFTMRVSDSFIISIDFCSEFTGDPVTLSNQLNIAKSLIQDNLKSTWEEFLKASC